MFDYQAGEKFKITLIMSGLAGLMAGIFFTLMLIPSTPEPPHRGSHGRYHERPSERQREIATGGQDDAQPSAYENIPTAQTSQVTYTPSEASLGVVNINTATTLLERWLPLSWDLSAASAKFSQEKAIAYMTSECASQYRKNIWTKSISDQITASGIISHFKLLKISSTQPAPDGSVKLYVQAEQQLDMPGRGSKARDLSVEYLIKQTSTGPKIAGITETSGG